MKTIRVAVGNNFNCTEKEFSELKTFVGEDHFFINSNIYTPNIQAINKHPYKAAITMNPNLTIDLKTLDILKTIKKNKIAFLRVKWIPGTPVRVFIAVLRSLGYPVVITMQRFNSKKTLLKHTTKGHYKFSCSRFRLSGASLKECLSFADITGSYICDRKGLGCGECKQCSTLTNGSLNEIYSLDLKSSGSCKFNCPDCYAKTMEHFVKGMGHKMKRGVIKKNTKQAGRTKHIKDNYEHLAEQESQLSMYEQGIL